MPSSLCTCRPQQSVDAVLGVVEGGVASRKRQPLNQHQLQHHMWGAAMRTAVCLGLLMLHSVQASIAGITVYQAQSFLAHNYSCGADSGTLVSAISPFLPNYHTVSCSTTFSFSSPPYSSLSLNITLATSQALALLSLGLAVDTNLWQSLLGPAGSLNAGCNVFAR